MLDMSSNSKNVNTSKIKDPLKFRKSILFNQYPSLKSTFKDSNMEQLMLNYLKIKKNINVFGYILFNYEYNSCFMAIF
jgi:hypothetical protein